MTKEVTMKTHLRIASLSLSAVLYLAVIVPASADNLYNNGPVMGTVDGWTINYGFDVSDSFTLRRTSTIQSFDFTVWTLPGDPPLTVDWSISSAANGGTIFGSGTANLTTQYLFTNQLGFDVDEETVTGLDVKLSFRNAWLNLQNAVTQQGNPLYWDENSGIGCISVGCPSLGEESSVGSIPSETFDINGAVQGGTLAEPSSMILLGSGILGLTTLVRRRMLDD
jgi:hypothetical protein